MKLYTLILLLAPVMAHSQTKLTIDEFNSRIDKAASDQRYRDSLIKSDGLNTLIPELVPPEIANTIDNDTVNTNSADQTKGRSSLESVDSSSANTGSSVSKGQTETPNSRSQTESTGATETDPKLQASTTGKKDTRGVDKKNALSANDKKAKTSRGQTQSLNSSVPNNKSSRATNKRNGEDFYFPSGMSVEKKSIIKPVSFTFGENRAVFGISLGTSIPVRLRRTSTNVQPGYIELVVTADVTGRKKTLPAESIIFARSSVVKGSSRLYLNSIKGVTPKGEEFDIRGHVSDHFNTAGLGGVIKSDGRAVARSVSKGGLALSSALASEIAGDALAAGANAAANQLIKEGSEQSSASLDKPAFIVSASPQKGVLTVEETF